MLNPDYKKVSKSLLNEIQRLIIERDEALLDVEVQKGLKLALLKRSSKEIRGLRDAIWEIYDYNFAFFNSNLDGKNYSNLQQSINSALKLLNETNINDELHSYTEDED